MKRSMEHEALMDEGWRMEDEECMEVKIEAAGLVADARHVACACALENWGRLTGEILPCPV